MGFMNFLFGKAPEPVFEIMPSAFSRGALERYLRGGDLIEAIRFVRAFSPMGLKEAKDFVEAFRRLDYSWEAVAREFPSLAEELGSPAGEEGDIEPADYSSEERELMDLLPVQYLPFFNAGNFGQIRDDVKGGRMIEAIKAIREVTGLGLKESKEIADALSAGMKAR